MKTPLGSDDGPVARRTRDATKTVLLHRCAATARRVRDEREYRTKPQNGMEEWMMEIALVEYRASLALPSSAPQPPPEPADNSDDVSIMDRAKAFLELSPEDSRAVVRLAAPPGSGCFYEEFALRGIRVDRVEPGLVACSFKVPPSLTDREGKLASGAIANLVDEVGGVLVHAEGVPMNVSVDMSISFLSSAKVHDELEITGKLLGKLGGYSGTQVLVKNKSTGDLIAEGRHSLFGKHASKL